MMSRRKAQGLSIPIGIAVAVLFSALMLIFYLYSNSISSTSISFIEESSRHDTTLYALLNNNEESPLTTIPFKNILSIALSNDVTKLDKDITLRYNNQVETVNMESILVTNLDKIGITDYRFYVEWDGQDVMTLSSGTKGNITETEYIAVPHNDPDKSIANVVLITKGTELSEDQSYCPNDDDMQCYPRLTCQEYGGMCHDSTYSCGILECCCSDSEI